MNRAYHIFGACSCWGAQIRACERGPEDLLETHVFDSLKKEGISIREIDMLYPLKRASEGEISLPKSLPIIYEFNLRLAKAVSHAIDAGLFPVVIGGDHSNAVGTWGGVRQAVQRKSSLPLGLLWIDAHMDAHTPETTPSGAWHGMPLAGLLGYGDSHLSRLLQKEPVFQPEHLVLIGIRSFEKGELALLERLKVKIYYIDEVKRRGFKAVLKEAIEIVAKGTAGFGVSMDMDAIDPMDAPGVGSPEPDGIPAEEALSVLPLIGKDPRLLGLEFVEFNPERDTHHKTRELIYQILKRVLG